MNISLKPSSKTKKGKSLGYGLNSRSSKPVGNVFGDDDEEDDSDGEADLSSNRSRVNRQIAKEQEALRQRAQAALQEQSNDAMYDYDGAYESFAAKPPPEETKTKEDRKSRYIGDLLQAAKRREQERDIIYERKVAKEQAEEDADFAGKEKFITKAYQRKLQERQQWQAAEDAKEASNVAPQTAGMASFYGNLSRNVAMGHGKSESSAQSEQEPDAKDDLASFDPRASGGTSGGGLGFLAGFERSEEPSESKENTIEKTHDNIVEGESFVESNGEPQPTDKPPVLSKRAQREKKVAEARIRYLKRKADMALQ